MRKKNKFGELFTEEIQENTANGVSVKTKKHINFGTRIIIGTYIGVKLPLKVVKFQISLVSVGIFRIHEDYVTTTMLTLMSLNGLLVLVAPNF